MRALRKRYELTVAWPHAASHARDLAAEAAANGISLVIAMGGDGIVHHVGQALVGTTSTLGIIPAGTTNVLGRLLGTPSRPTASVKMLANPPGTVTSPVLIVETDGPGGPGRTAALFSFGVGPDAAIVERAESEPYRKYRLGSIHYARTAVATIRDDLRKRDTSITVEVAGRKLPAIGLMAQFRPVYTYFGRLPMRLGPRPPDPVSVLVIRNLRMRRTLSMLRGALGRDGLGQVRGLRLEEHLDHFAAWSDQPMQIQADGELLGRVNTVSAFYSPQGLKVVVPQSPLR